MVELENPWIRVTVMPEIGGQDLDGGREVHREAVPLRQPGGQVPGRGHARPVDERGHRGQLRHHRPHSELRDAGGLPHAAEPGRERLGRDRGPRPPDPHALAARDHPARRQGVLHDHLALAQRDAPRAAVLHVDERRPQGGRQPAVRLPGHALHRPRGRGEPLADRPEDRARPVLLREKRLRPLQVVPRAGPPVRLLGRLLARRRLRHGPLLPARREARQEDLDLGPLPAGDDLGEAPHRHRRAVRRGPVRAACSTRRPRAARRRPSSTAAFPPTRPTRGPSTGSR